MFWIIAVAAILQGPAVSWAETDLMARADAAHRALEASHRYMEGWLEYRDSETGLIPQRLDSPLWTPENSAADHYAFMVITAYFTDEEWLAGTVREILDAEMRLTTRLGSLPDTLDLTTRTYSRDEVDLERLLFGASEYCKDGLLPITELMGRTPWTDRMATMARDIAANSPVETQWGRLPAGGAEVNGEMLQVFSRLHGVTGDPTYLDAAVAIGDAYFLGVLPANGGIPCHLWDFDTMTAVNPALSLIDHGSEIIGGLSEVYAAAVAHRPDKAAQWRSPFLRMLDTVLERSLNQRGILSMAPEGEGGVPDTWGYVYNAYYTAYLLTGEERYRAAVLDALEAATHYREWGGADAFADCEEGALVLLNREPRAETFAWLADLLESHYAHQREDGIIEGWYGDGNSARTWLMWAMYNTGGTRLFPWRSDVRWGALWDESLLTLLATAEKPWSGRLFFDRPRHRDHMGLSLNYPRLNEWPEWWPVDSGALYRVEMDGESRVLPGYRLIEGLPVGLRAGEPLRVTVRRTSDYPHGVPAIALEGPAYINLHDGQRTARLTCRNLTEGPITANLTATAGTLAADEVSLPPSGEVSIEWTLPGDAERRQTVVASPTDGGMSARASLRVIDQPGLVAFIDFPRPEQYADEGYWWLGRGPISAEVDLGNEREVAVLLRWGAKNDQRHARLTLGDASADLAHGGYDGFEWLEVPLVLPEGRRRVTLTIERAPDGPVAFLADLLIVAR